MLALGRVFSVYFRRGGEVAESCRCNQLVIPILKIGIESPSLHVLRSINLDGLWYLRHEVHCVHNVQVMEIMQITQGTDRKIVRS